MDQAEWVRRKRGLEILFCGLQIKDGDDEWGTVESIINQETVGVRLARRPYYDSWRNISFAVQAFRKESAAVQWQRKRALIRRRRSDEAARIAALDAEREKREVASRERVEALRVRVALRGIQALLHFTPIENLKAIFEHGLLPRAAVPYVVPNAIVEDELRLDGREGTVSLSVTWPNQDLFWRRRKSAVGREYAVLAIAPRVLWEQTALFCVTNAASKSISSVNDNVLDSVDAFERLFGDAWGDVRSQKQCLCAYPQNPQAEVLVRGHVEPKDILKVCVETESAVARCVVECRVPAALVRRDSTWFGYRCESLVARSSPALGPAPSPPPSEDFGGMDFDDIPF